MNAAVLNQAIFASNSIISSSESLTSALNESVSSSSSSSTAASSTSCELIEMNLENKEKSSLKEDNREKNFTFKNILNSIHHPFTSNNKSTYTSYFYTNTNTILNKFVMSYEEQLHKAIVKGNYELCNELIIKKCDVNEQFNKKFPLCLACEHNFYEIAELLIKVGANVNQFDFYDQSCLIYAVCYADLNIVELLVQNGADVNKSDSNGVYPLHVAINRQNDIICDFLLKNGALINVIDKQGNTPLALAINNDYFYMINLLLDLGADTNISDNNGDTCLIKSIWLTLSSSMDKSKIINTVTRLIECGADINAVNESGRTALFSAIYQNNTDIALYLIEKGAKCELEDILMSNFTLLHYACFQGNYTLVKALLEKKCDPNAIAASCESAVYIAVTKGYIDIVSLLIDYGADVNLFIGTDQDNKCTALQAAVYYLSNFDLFKNIVNKLIEGNADLKIAVPGPIIYICLQYNKNNYAKYLISVGADLEQRTLFNQSAFYKAFLNKNLDFMQLCILAGFNLKKEPWIDSYLVNPDFIEYTDYYIKRATSQEINGDDNSDSEGVYLIQKTDQEISDMINLDEYYFERYHYNYQNKKMDKNKTADLAKKIYNLIKYHYTNPLSLKELARIQVRKSLLNVNYKMKFKIENDLPLPKCMKDYLLFKEFF